MEAEASNTAKELKRMIAAALLSEDALHGMSQIPVERVQAFLDEEKRETGLTAAPHALSLDESTRISLLTVQLSEGLSIGDDDRLKAIIESLTVDCRLTPANVAGLTGTELADVELALREPDALLAETKYRLAIRASYIVNAVNRARVAL